MGMPSPNRGRVMVRRVAERRSREKRRFMELSWIADGAKDASKCGPMRGIVARGGCREKAESNRERFGSG
jgi:hypothetical protein